jgi:protein associated with RNAse G/E
VNNLKFSESRAINFYLENGKYSRRWKATALWDSAPCSLIEADTRSRVLSDSIIKAVMKDLSP